MSDLQKLYQERAELAELESDCDEAIKHTWRNGLFYRFFLGSSAKPKTPAPMCKQT